MHPPAMCEHGWKDIVRGLLSSPIWWHLARPPSNSHLAPLGTDRELLSAPYHLLKANTFSQTSPQWWSVTADMVYLNLLERTCCWGRTAAVGSSQSESQLSLMLRLSEQKPLPGFLGAPGSVLQVLKHPHTSQTKKPLRSVKHSPT